jgi:hypothetical protein
VLPQGWKQLYLNPDDGSSDESDTDDDGMGCPAAVDVLQLVPTLDPDAVDPGFSDLTLPTEDLRARAERVRARKGGKWVKSKTTTQDLTVTLITTEAAEEYMHTLFMQQSSEAWKGNDGTASLPLVQHCQPGKSPVTVALDRWITVMHTNEEQVMQLLKGLVF